MRALRIIAVIHAMASGMALAQAADDAETVQAIERECGTYQRQIAENVEGMKYLGAGGRRTQFEQGNVSLKVKYDACVERKRVDVVQGRAAVEAATIKRAADARTKAEADAREAKDKVDTAARMSVIAVDKKALATIYGALICEQKDDRADALAEILKQKKYSRIGGAVDLTALKEQQDALRHADELISGLSAGAKKRGVTAFACTGAEVKAVRKCRGAPSCDQAHADMANYGNVLSEESE